MSSASSPITNICIIAEKSNCPPLYSLLAHTTNGSDADLWKDSFWKGKVERYFCFTKELSKNQQQQLYVTDIALVNQKDPIPPGYSAIKTTMDSQEQALKKHILCVRYVISTATQSAISDIMLCTDGAYREKMYTLAGELNGINIAFKLAEITNSPPVPARRAAPPGPPQQIGVENVQPLNAQNRSNHTPTPHHQQANHNNEGSVLDGIEFKLHERLCLNDSNSSAVKNEIPHITFKTLTELTESTYYDFSKEKSIIFSPS